MADVDSDSDHDDDDVSGHDSDSLSDDGGGSDDEESGSESESDEEEEKRKEEERMKEEEKKKKEADRKKKKDGEPKSLRRVLDRFRSIAPEMKVVAESDEDAIVAMFEEAMSPFRELRYTTGEIQSLLNLVTDLKKVQIDVDTIAKATTSAVRAVERAGEEMVATAMVGRHRAGL